MKKDLTSLQESVDTAGPADAYILVVLSKKEGEGLVTVALKGSKYELGLMLTDLESAFIEIAQEGIQKNEQVH